MKHLVNIFRRLHRIFAHAWFQHRSVFWDVESQTGLYVLFKTVCDTYQLLPAENYKLPPEAEGLDVQVEAKPVAPTILRSTTQLSVADAEEENWGGFKAGHTKTSRHVRQSPSMGSSIGTLLEADEEGHDVAGRSGKTAINENAATVMQEETKPEPPVHAAQPGTIAPETLDANGAEPESAAEEGGITENQVPSTESNLDAPSLPDEPFRPDDQIANPLEASEAFDATEAETDDAGAQEPMNGEKSEGSQKSEEKEEMHGIEKGADEEELGVGASDMEEDKES